MNKFMIIFFITIVVVMAAIFIDLEIEHRREMRKQKRRTDDSKNKPSSELSSFLLYSLYEKIF